MNNMGSALLPHGRHFPAWQARSLGDADDGGLLSGASPQDGTIENLAVALCHPCLSWRTAVVFESSRAQRTVTCVSIWRFDFMLLVISPHFLQLSFRPTKELSPAPSYASCFMPCV